MTESGGFKGKRQQRSVRWEERVVEMKMGNRNEHMFKF